MKCRLAFDRSKQLQTTRRVIDISSYAAVRSSIFEPIMLGSGELSAAGSLSVCLHAEARCRRPASSRVASHTGLTSCGAPRASRGPRLSVEDTGPRIVPESLCAVPLHDKEESEKGSA